MARDGSYSADYTNHMSTTLGCTLAALDLSCVSTLPAYTLGVLGRIVRRWHAVVWPHRVDVLRQDRSD